jgi:hypothetical protein
MSFLGCIERVDHVAASDVWWLIPEDVRRRLAEVRSGSHCSPPDPLVGLMAQHGNATAI